MARANSTARQVTEWIESTLRVPAGANAGEDFTLMPWQREFVRGAFRQGTVEAALSIARSNGKSMLCSALMASCIHPDGPLHEKYITNILVSGRFGQAAISFKHVLSLLETCRKPVDLSDRKLWSATNSTVSMSIRYKSTGCEARCLAASAKGLHGLGQWKIALADEPTQWPTNEGPAMRSALVSAGGKVAGSLRLALGTRPASDSWFADLLEGDETRGLHRQVYSVAKDTPLEDLGKRRTWARANPSMRYFPVLLADLQASWDGATNEDDVAAFKSSRLNMGVSDVGQRGLIDPDLWRSLEGDAMREGKFVMGLDAGGSRSMSAASAFWPATGRLEVMATFPAVPSIEEREKMDKCRAGAYTSMIDRGELYLSGNRMADVPGLVRRAVATWGRPLGVVADRFRKSEVMQVLEECKLPIPLQLRRNGWFDGSADIRGFRRVAFDNRLVPAKSLLLRSSIADCRVEFDRQGNERLLKRQAFSRDDAAYAMVLAVAAAERIPDLWRSRDRRRVVAV